MEKSDKSFGAMYKESLKFQELELGIYELIDLSKVPYIYKMKGSNICKSKYYPKINNRTLNPKQLLGILRSIIEYANYEMVKNKNAGHITPSS